MNGERTFGQPIQDEQLSALMNVLVNCWWQKWKRQPATDEIFLRACDELDTIMKQGEQYPVVRNLGITFLYELSARMHGGYTETERDKLVALIQQEGRA